MKMRTNLAASDHEMHPRIKPGQESRIRPPFGIVRLVGYQFTGWFIYWFLLNAFSLKIRHPRSLAIQCQERGQMPARLCESEGCGRAHTAVPNVSWKTLMLPLIVTGASTLAVIPLELLIC
jgi:hypothetical protein